MTCWIFMNRRPNQTIAGRGKLSRKLEDARQLESDDPNVAILSIDNDTTRVKIGFSAGTSPELRFIEAQWPHERQDGQWQLESKVSYRIASWVEHDDVRLPRVVYRAAFKDSDAEDGDNRSTDTASRIRVTRVGISTANETQLGPEVFAPEFEVGWTIVDTRLRMIYIIGDQEVEIDGDYYTTREPMHPRLVSRIGEIILHKVKHPHAKE